MKGSLRRVAKSGKCSEVTHDFTSPALLYCITGFGSVFDIRETFAKSRM
jgi:hypothetical protein